MTRPELSSVRQAEDVGGSRRPVNSVVFCSVWPPWIDRMASLYQRFGGKINTSRSFPVTPEASHLLGPRCSEEDGAAAAAAAASAHAAAGAAKASRPSQPHNPRPRFQYQARRSDGEEEDVSQPLPDSWGGRTRVGESRAPRLGCSVPSAPPLGRTEQSCPCDGLKLLGSGRERLCGDFLPLFLFSSFLSPPLGFGTGILWKLMRKLWVSLGFKRWMQLVVLGNICFKEKLNRGSRSSGKESR